jgi:hypothetical protein
MNRREALSATALLLGGTIVGAQTFLSGCSAPKKNSLPFGPEDISLLDEVAETILPETPDSPGAKAAKIGEFMKIMVTECYGAEDQKIFDAGILSVREASEKMFGDDFMKLSAQQKRDLLSSLDKEAKESKTGKSPTHYFTMMKQLTVWGYFTSEPGATKAMRYVAVPGKFEGCVPYKEGEKAWAT